MAKYVVIIKFVASANLNFLDLLLQIIFKYTYLRVGFRVNKMISKEHRRYAVHELT